MDEKTEVIARKHGGNGMAIACRHIVRFAESGAGKPVGLHWAPSDKKPYPDVWCTSCDSALTEAGGEWTPKLYKRAGLRLLCPCCYEMARAMSEPGAVFETLRLR